jgi:signal transduction histidine kinase
VTFLEELFAYVGFDDADRARLAELHPRLAPQFPAIASRFYDAVFASAGAASVLSGSAQVDRLRVTLVDWMSSGLLGPHDERFYEKRSRIGRRHVAIGLESQYMFTAMNVIRLAYQDRIVESYPPGDALAVMRSVHKLLDCELAIMVQHYELDTEEKLVLRERKTQADRILAMQTMSAGLAHEVRNPLNAAKLQLELLERRLSRQSDDPDPRLLGPTELAQKEIERLTTLLNEFLVFARPPELHAQEHDVVAIVRHVIDLERIAVGKRGAMLDLVAEPAELLAEVDATKLHQLVQNLVRNAGEAVAAGGQVVVRVGVDDARFRISIKDDGPGIPDHIRSRIYEPFFSTKEGGTGLGMSIVHSLVSLHGGAIELETGPQGTTFDVAIPRWR